MDAEQINNIFGNLNKEDIITEVTKQKMIKIKSESHQERHSFWMLKILIIFFKLIGLATFAHRIVTRKKRSSYIFQYSKFGIVYNIVLISLIIASSYVPLSYRIGMEYIDKTDFSFDILQAVLGILMICTILLIYCIDQKSLVRIANRLMYVEHEIDLYHLYHPLQRQRIFCTVIIVCVLKVCLFILLLTMELLVFQDSSISWQTDILSTFHISWVLIQYFLLVTIIQADFADVNQALQSLTKVNMLQPQSLYQTRRVIISNSTIHQLLQLRDMHYHLCEISEDVSDFYSLPVLFGLTFFFLMLIYNSYFLLSFLFMTNEILENVFLVSSGNIIWVIFLIYPISLLTNRITKILNEVGRTGNVIHSLLSCAIGKEIKSETYLLQLKQFSLQLLHRKIQFTANGYFALDNCFLNSLIGTVTTYLVILVQFQMGSSSSRSHCNCTGEDLLKEK